MYQICVRSFANCNDDGQGDLPGILSRLDYLTGPGVDSLWPERGVDGFSHDVHNAYFKHPGLPDNRPQFGLRGFDQQWHHYDMDQQKIMPLLKGLRELLDSSLELFHSRVR